MIIYIHGFGGSGQGAKAKAFRDYFHSMGKDFMAPSLPYNPTLAIESLKELISSCQGGISLIGSSLGGYYATHLSSMSEVERVVLINPATKPYVTLERALGRAPNFYDATTFEWNEVHLAILKKLESERLDLKKFMVLLQKGDTLLDYSDAAKKYEGAEIVIEEGGDHSFQGIERHFETIRDFFAL